MGEQEGQGQLSEESRHKSASIERLPTGSQPRADGNKKNENLSMSSQQSTTSRSHFWEFGAGAAGELDGRGDDIEIIPMITGRWYIAWQEDDRPHIVYIQIAGIIKTTCLIRAKIKGEYNS